MLMQEKFNGHTELPFTYQLFRVVPMSSYNHNEHDNMVVEKYVFKQRSLAVCKQGGT
jgi:hypothetical protein